MNQETSKQHYVPKFYLRRFTNDKNELEVFDAATQTILKPVGPKGVAYEDYFYGIRTGKPDEISQQIEKFFQNIENDIGKKFDSLTDKILGNGAFTYDEKWIIALLMSMLWIRGPAMRSIINNMTESFMKQANAVLVNLPSIEQEFDEMDKASGETTSKESREMVKEMIREKKYNLKFDNAFHISMFNNVRNFANLFFGQHWLVFISKCDKKFITTDNPVAVILPKTTGFWGATFLERTHMFPLTPDILIVARDPQSGKTFKRKTIFDNEAEKVINLNVAAGHQVINYAFAKNKKDLEDLKVGIYNFVKFAKRTKENR